MNAQSIFGSVAIGKDTSGNFKQSIYGLAVRSTPDGKFIARHDDELVDVTDLTFDGTENLIYRLPKEMPKPKDIIVRSDSPFSVIFATEVDGGTVKGIDPATGELQEYRPVTNLLNVHFFVTVVGPDSLLEKNNGANALLPLLLLGGQGTGANTTDPLATILLMRSLGSKELDNNALTMLLLLKGGLAGGTNDPLALILALQGSDLFAKEKRSGAALGKAKGSVGKAKGLVGKAKGSVGKAKGLEERGRGQSGQGEPESE
jgi:hypothetical protein